MMLFIHRPRPHAIVAAALVLLLAACGGSAEPPVPTREPAPTFTPTLAEQPTPVDPAVAAAAATASAQQAAQAAQPAPAAEQPTQPPAEQPTETPTPEPTPVAPAEVVISANVNVRGGPGTGYNILGAATPGQRFPVTGRNEAGDWWQINFNGQVGWVFGALVTTQNTEGVAVALNIPAPPPPTPTSSAPPPTNTSAPQPPAEQPAEQPAPAPAPSQNYEFSKALVQRCDPNAGVTYVQGTVYKSGSPINGYRVVFSYAPDGPPVTEPVISGPHQGYEGWRTGFYSHILQHDGPREGNWFFWIVDGSGTRISAIANVHTDGEAGDGKCQQAVVDFDS